MSDYIINSPEIMDETGQVFRILNQEYKAGLSEKIKKMDLSYGLEIKD